MLRRVQNRTPYEVQIGSLCLEIWLNPDPMGQILNLKAYDPVAYLHEYSVAIGKDGLLYLCGSKTSYPISPIDARCNPRYCNYHGRELEHFKSKDNKIDGWSCPARGCTVSWWGNPKSLPATKIVREARKRLFDLTQQVKVSLSQCRELSDYLWSSPKLTRAIEDEGLGIGYMNLHECQCFIKLLRGEAACSIISGLTTGSWVASGRSLHELGGKPKSAKALKTTTVIQSIRSISIEDLPDE